jgi:hypothetical protein
VFPVTSLGAAVLPLVGRPGRVHSVYRRALNVELGQELVAVLAGGMGRLPHGLHLEGAQDLDRLGVEPDAPVSWAGRGVRLGGALGLDLSRAAVWADECAALPTAPPDRLASNLRRARNRVPASPLLTRPLRALGRALQSGEEAAVGGAVGALVGLGPGLTPAGDDALLGCLAVLQIAGHPAADRVAAAACAAAGRTTALSRTLLRHAASGRAAELTLDVARALVAAPAADGAGADPPRRAPRTRSGHPGHERLDAALTRLLAQGATSGRDTAEGALLGLAILVGVET